MKLKSILLVVSIFCIIGLLLLLIPDQTDIEVEDKSEPFSEQPEQFVDVYTNDLTYIDISYITNYKSVVQDEFQVYTFAEDNYTHFTTDIIYNGEIYQNQVLLDDSLKLRVGSNMTPNDGIPEGYIVQKINEYSSKNITSYIFVDEDWKLAYPQTFVHWGATYERTVAFVFTQISPGVYMNKITDDPDRFIIGYGVSRGGILVGPLTKDDVENRNENVTAMRLR